MRVRLHVIAAAALFACGTPKEPNGSTPASMPAGSGTGATGAPTSTPVTPTPSATTAPVATFGIGDLFAKVKGDLTACYEEGRKAIPTMTSAKLTFHVSIDASGKTACVVPSDDTGLTQEVESCMRMRLEKETYAKRDAPWSLALPIVVKDAKLSLGEMRDTPSAIETIESHGLAEDVYDVVDGLLPDLYGCVQGIPKSSEMRVVYVGAKVGGSGQVECALASASSSIPVETRTCTAKVLGRAKFRAPKKGFGLVSVPLNVMSRK